MVMAAAESGAACAADSQALYLQVFVNGLDRQTLVRVDQVGDALYISADELAAVGVKTDGLPLRGDRSIALRDIPAASYRYDPFGQRLDLDLPASLLVPQVLSYARTMGAAPRSGTGVVLNYAAYVQSDDVPLSLRDNRLLAPLIDDGYGGLPSETRSVFARAYDERNQSVTLDTDFRVFAPAGLFVNGGYVTQHGDGYGYTRDDTYWMYTGVDKLRRYTVGDFITSSLTWTRALRLGGARVARNFDVRPDLVTFPVPAFGGTAVVPTTVDLYVNGVRHFSGEAQGGPFIISEPPALTGAGLVAIRYRDELGRVVATTQPLYIDSRLLDSGLSDYAFEAGYPRRNYGTDSSDYASEAAAAGSWRYGVTSAFTIESHGEVGDYLQNVGVGGLLRLGRRFGVLSAALAISDADGHGKLTSAGYQYIAPHWAVDLFDRRSHGGYADLGTLEGVPVPDRLTRAAFSFTFAGRQAFSLNYARQQAAPELGGSRIVSFGYNGNWFRSRVNTYVSLFRDVDRDDANGVYVSVSVNFGDRSSAYSGASHYGNDRTQILGMGRPVDYDLGGFGWNVATERGNDDYERGSLRLDYRNRFGDWSAELEKDGNAQGERTNASLYGRGALVLMDRTVLATRSIYDGFALVSTSGTPGVPVLRENRVLGETNRHGFLLVPDLPSYRTSHLAIDTLELPVDVSIGTSSVLVNPRERSGLLAEFPLDRYRGATLVVVDEDGQPLPVGTPVALLGTDVAGLIGYDGQVFFATLQPSNRLSIESDRGHCEIDVAFDATQAMRTLGPFTCAVEGAR